MDYSNLPKIELHLHLDCSLSFAVVQQINPLVDYETYQRSFVGPVKCTGLADFLARTTHGIGLMQTKAELRLVTLDLFQQLKADNVIYAEIRFAPLLHLQKGLTSETVVQTVNEATSEGMATTGVEAGIILCTLRHFEEAQSMETVRLVEQFRGTNVVGFDIASDEAGFPVDQHVKAFDFAKEHALNITAHAGEARGAESVWETLRRFHPTRIGHGVRSMEDPRLMEYLKKAGIHLEVCPTSNVQTNVVDRIENHPADKIYRSGVSMSISTDARTISNTCLAHEYHAMQEMFGWEKADFFKCNLEAVEHAFISEQKKATLRETIMAAYQSK
ncbi:MAG: adenosine deaminase [Bacteroidetes bacterium]|nr:adenosine deaminase [Bacteroidota bacterium]